MKKYNVEVVRVSYASKTFEVSAEDASQAKNRAFDMAMEDDYSGNEYDYEYKVNTPQEIRNDYIDQYGNPYDSEDPNACLPAGGGLHRDCEFNADALYAFYVVKDRYRIGEYLLSKGFRNVKCENNFEMWTKGNTKITYKCYDFVAGAWRYMHTEKIINH